MKFQNPSIHHSKVNTQTDTRTDKPKAICPSNFFKVGGINMSHLMGKLCENKDADQLRGNREADQRLCFRYTNSILPLLFKSEISSFQPASVTVQPGLCRTCSETTLLVFPRGGSIIQG